MTPSWDSYAADPRSVSRVPPNSVSSLARELKRSKYRLLGLVGQGQFGRVYCASHRKTGHLVALKELDKQRFPTHKFLRELRFLLSLQHDNIVTCHALEHTASGRYLVMDYCEGGTLRSLMEEDVRLHPLHCLKLVSDVLAGLDHAHSRGIIHCDIKPENILLTLQPQGWTARISDFGIARLHQEIARGEGNNTGSPAYMAPERFYGQHSYSSDLYAVGVLLFELLAGRRPFSGAPSELMSAHLNQPVRIPETIPPPLQPIILTALQKLQARRFRSAGEMLTAVKTAAKELPFYLEQEWTDALLLRSRPTSPPNVFLGHRLENLHTEIHQLVSVTRRFMHPSSHSIGSNNTNAPVHDSPTVALPPNELSYNQVYRVCRGYIGCQRIGVGSMADPSYPAASNSLPPILTVPLPEPIQSIQVCPQGCFVITHRAVYLIPLPRLQTEWALEQFSGLQIIATFSSDFLAAIEPQGRWLAVATKERNEISPTLRFWQTVSRQAGRQAQFPVDVMATAGLSSSILQLLALDSRHLAAFSQEQLQQTDAPEVGIRLDVFACRGKLVGSLRLPVPLRQFLKSSLPYRLLALEPKHPTAIVLMDLKPLRMQRIGVGIEPLLMAATCWGYVLVAATGDMVLLNQCGQMLSRLQGPENPTAIAVLEPYSLLIATWNNGQGGLYRIDLQQAGLDLVF